MSIIIPSQGSATPKKFLGVADIYISKINLGCSLCINLVTKQGLSVRFDKYGCSLSESNMWYSTILSTLHSGTGGSTTPCPLIMSHGRTSSSVFGTSSHSSWPMFTARVHVGLIILVYRCPSPIGSPSRRGSSARTTSHTYHPLSSAKASCCCRSSTNTSLS